MTDSHNNSYSSNVSDTIDNLLSEDSETENNVYDYIHDADDLLLEELLPTRYETNSFNYDSDGIFPTINVGQSNDNQFQLPLQTSATETLSAEDTSDTYEDNHTEYSIPSFYVNSHFTPNDDDESFATSSHKSTTAETKEEILYDFLLCGNTAPLPVQHMNYICEICDAMFFPTELTKRDREKYDKRMERSRQQQNRQSVSFARCCGYGKYAEFKYLFDTVTLDDNFVNLILGKHFPQDTEENKERKKTSELFHNHITSFNNSLAFSFLHCTKKVHKKHGPQPFALTNMHVATYLTRDKLREFTDTEKEKGYDKDQLTGHQLYFLDNTMHWQIIKRKTNNTFRTESQSNQNALNSIFNTLRHTVLNSALCNKLKQLKLIPALTPPVQTQPNPDTEHIESVFQIARQTERNYVAPNTNDHPVMLYQDTALSRLDMAQIIPHDSYLTTISQRNNFYMSLLFPLLSPFKNNILPMYTNEIKQLFPGLQPLQFYRMYLNIWKSDARVNHGPQNTRYNLINYCTKLFQMMLCILYCSYRAAQLNIFNPGSINSKPHNIFGSSTYDTTSKVPSTVPLSRRNLKLFERQLNALVLNFGNPHLFITWTTSKDWEEFGELLSSRESLYDRPDITVRVFFVKLQQVLQRLDAMFGGLTAFGYRIEHQARGLPHIHLLLWLNKGLNKKTIDNLIVAEIPDDTDKQYKQLVLKHYIHRHYKHANNPCQQGTFGKCNKHFPYNFIDETTFENGQWFYKRRQSNETIVTTTQGNSYPLSNQYVVPHIKYLAKLLKGHSCVLALPSLMTIKYMIKYVSKSEPQVKAAYISDPTIQNIHKSPNEVAQFKTYKSVDPMLAVTEILAGSQLTKVQPSIQSLPIHLEGKHYESGRMDVTRAAVTELVAYFRSQEQEYNLCSNKHMFQGIAYYDYPKYYVFDKRERIWKKRARVRHDIITQLHTFSHRGIQTELIYLRWLLLHVTDARSFQQLRTVGIHVYPSFAAAAEQRGLVNNDALLHGTLKEAKQMLNHTELLSFYVTCLTHFPAMDPSKLYREHVHDKLVDRLNFNNSGELDETELRKKIYFLLADAADKQGVTLVDLNLDSFIVTDTNTTLREFQQDEQHLKAYKQYQRESENKLTIKPLDQYKGQIKKIILRITNQLSKSRTQRDHISSFEHIHLFNSSAGSGKTTLLNTIISELKQKYTVLAVSPTGKASLLLIGGYTLHRLFRLPIDIDSFYKHPTRNTKIGSLAFSASVLIVDEIFSVHNTNIARIDNFLRDIKGTDLPFGGITTLLFGDIKQTLPIVPYGNHEQQKQASLASTSLFLSIPHRNRYKLNKNYRIISSYNNKQSNSRTFFSHFHNSILTGSPDSRTVKLLRCCLQEATKAAHSKYKSPPHQHAILTPIPTCFVTRHKHGALIETPFTSQEIMIYQTMSQIIAAVFPDIDNMENGNDFIMTTTRATCEQINQAILDKLDTTEYELHAIDTPLEYLSINGPTTDDLPDVDTKSTNLLPRCIKTKQNAICAITRNIDPSQGLTNGQRIRIIKCTEYIITAHLIQDDGTCGNVVLIPRITVNSNRSNDFAFLSRYQFPITNAFAITIDKSQGTTGNKVGIYLDKPVFTHGQLGVAVTRVGHHKRLFIAIENADVNPAHGLVEYTCPECKKMNCLMFTFNIVDADLINLCNTGSNNQH